MNVYSSAAHTDSSCEGVSTNKCELFILHNERGQNLKTSAHSLCMSGCLHLSMYTVSWSPWKPEHQLLQTCGYRWQCATTGGQKTNLGSLKEHQVHKPSQAPLETSEWNSNTYKRLSSETIKSTENNQMGTVEHGAVHKQFWQLGDKFMSQMGYIKRSCLKQ